MQEIYQRLFETGDQISVSAWNGWWATYRLRGGVKPTDVVPGLGGLTVGGLASSLLVTAWGVLVIALGWRPTVRQALLGGAFLAFTFFMLPMKMHERYLFPVFALLAPIAILERRWLAMYALLSLTFLLNLYSVFPLPAPADIASGRQYLVQPIDVAVSAANVVLYVVFTVLLVSGAQHLWQRDWLGFATGAGEATHRLDARVARIWAWHFHRASR